MPTMICPNCGDEFRPGFYHCPDCDVAVVEIAQTDVEAESLESVELMRTANMPHLAVVKALLDSESIPYSVSGEEAMLLVTVLPSAHFATPTSFGARLYVPGDRHAEALELLEAAEAEADA